MRASPVVDAPYFVEVRHDGARHPHDGRFLRLDPSRLVELTWLTGAGGTEGAETIVTVEFAPCGDGTLLGLTQAGFASAAARDGHERAWPAILAHLDDRTAPFD